MPSKKFVLLAEHIQQHKHYANNRAMAKRKREVVDARNPAKALKSGKEGAASTPKRTVRTESPAHRSKETAVNGQATTGAESKATAGSISNDANDTTTVQIITGSYERVLHGFTAAIPHSLVTGKDDTAEEDRPKIEFSDTFLFNAHISAIRCLALTPPTEESSKVILASGSTDERINLYTLSTAPPAPSKSKPKLPSLHGASVSENSKNKELGALLHHASSVTALYFPSRSKLLSSSEDSTITITRTRDWAALSTIKAPIPKVQGRPSGDTAAPGEVPAGVNDFAVHPSNKLMVSVSKGEKCMRLWNLITGKKAGVFNFSRDILASVGEGRFGSGEGRKIVWDAASAEELAVAFERSVVIFSIDIKPKAKILPTPRTKIHQVRYLDGHPGILLVSTEDGRIMAYDTNSATAPAGDGDKEDDIPQSNLIAAIGGPAAGFSGRVKDFEILQLSGSTFLIISGSSDGTVRLWKLDAGELKASGEADKDQGFAAAKQVGKLLGTYTTGTRITCLKAFVMTGTPGAEEDEDEDEDVPAEKDGDESSGESSE
ncbi:WD40 repeat-like protein [Bimuria novae-zelandiae CBS 107.79]|uniref:WD40 repeat-like protein n=1 Tax=Bimuria novae-zelandiae CBS 107.79 TaxID=1447943 RepID=A0A6A5VDQ2_9PLEO|nr:WD40 repeat-like protein [Bimuria novae-zelandiae CBS 107.79]